MKVVEQYGIDNGVCGERRQQTCPHSALPYTNLHKLDTVRVLMCSILHIVFMSHYGEKTSTAPKLGIFLIKVGTEKHYINKMLNQIIFTGPGI